MINTGANNVSSAPHNRTNLSVQAQTQAHLQHSKLSVQQQQLLRQRQQQQLQQQQQQQQLAQQRQQRPNLQNYHFASTSPEILKKYAKYPPSLSFHIYESHYRLSNSQDSNIIPKSSPMIKSFLQHVMREEIPFEMSELIKDFAIRSYDGCLILQVYDHRNMIPTGAPNSSNANSSSASTANNTDSSNPSGSASTNINTTANTTKDTSGPASKSSSPSQNGGNTMASSTATTTSESTKVISKPKAYRTLLRPTQLSLYYDLLYHTDSALTKFTDPLSLQMESEILTLTNRKVDLSVPLNPYLCEDYLKPEIDYPRKEWDEKNQDWKLIHLHRDEVKNPPRKLHQDELIMHKSSDYEEIMFLLSNKYKRSDDTLDKKLVVVGSSSLVSTGTTNKNGKEDSADPEDKGKNSEAKNGSTTVVNSNTSSNSTTGQFMRLRYIEEIRKRREAQKAQQEAVAAQAANNGANLLAQSNNAATINATKETVPDNKGSFAPQDSNIVRPGSQPPPAPANLQLQRQQQMMTEKAQALRARQFQAQQQAQQQARQQLQQQQQQQFQQQTNKRQKTDHIQQQPPQPPQSQQQQPQQPYNSISSTPQMGMSQPASSMGTPVMNGNMPTPQQRFQQAQQQALSQQPPQSAPSQPQSQGQINALSPGQTPGTAQNQPNQTQIQQQQIFQNTLNPQEQQTFRQLQSRMNAFAMMGNSGIAPNRAQLTQQQQQQAIQQAKLIQQQLLQKFPVYFQRLRQFQLLQQQRRQQQQQQQQQPQPSSQSPQPMGNIPPSLPQNSQFNQHQNVGGKTVPGAMSPQQQQMINQQMLQQMANNMNQQGKKKMYKKK